MAKLYDKTIVEKRGGYQRYRLSWKKMEQPVAITWAFTSRADEYFRFLEAHYPKVQDPIKEDFWTFVQQAKSFWKAAEKQDFKSAPLSYYYSFLNLAKALLILKGYKSDPMYHGMVDRAISPTKEQSFFDSKIKIDNRNPGQDVFPLLATEFGVALFQKNKAEVDLKSLISLVSEIQYQAGSLLGEGYNGRIFRGFQAFLFRKEKGKEGDVCRIVFAIAKSAQAENDLKDKAELLNAFDLTEREDVKLWLDLNAWEQKAFDYFLSGPEETLTPKNIWEQFHNVLGGHFQPNLFSDQNDFSYIKSIRMKFQESEKDILLPEPLAIYLIMYFLSSTVRYRPIRLKDDDPATILIEHLIESCPIIVLAHLSGLILNQLFWLKSR